MGERKFALLSGDFLSLSLGIMKNDLLTDKPNFELVKIVGFVPAYRFASDTDKPFTNTISD